MTVRLSVDSFIPSSYGNEKPGYYGPPTPGTETAPFPAPGVPQVPTQTTSGTGTSPGNGFPSSSTTGPSSPAPKNYSAGIDLKSRLLQPALTTHYQVWISLEKFRNFPSIFDGTLYDFMGKLDSRLPGSSELLLISCSEASLPGSSLTTQELNDDYTGITQRHAYRRLYDDRIDFTFYVNQTYDQIRFFERWIQFISGEQISTNEENHFIRFKFPQTYKTTIFIDKFERNAQRNVGKDKETNGPHTGAKLSYEFINAFPISINSMPVSYDSSQLLKCTVAFSYDRYLMKNISVVSTETEPSQTPATGVPNLSSAQIIGESQTRPFDLDYQLAPVPGQFTVPPGQGGDADLFGGIGVRNPVVR
jgi:hypothetical protein